MLGPTTVDVVKLDDCNFEAKDASKSLAKVNLRVLSNEYQQSSAPYGTSITVIGSGEAASICTFFSHSCYKDLTLGRSGTPGSSGAGQTSWHAFRALQFLQTYCPPQKLPF